VGKCGAQHQWRRYSSLVSVKPELNSWKGYIVCFVRCCSLLCASCCKRYPVNFPMICVASMLVMLMNDNNVCPNELEVDE